MNPLVPNGWDIFFSVLVWVSVALTVVALISLLRSKVGARAPLLWVLFVLLVPGVGATAWLVTAYRLRAVRGPRRADVSNPDRLGA